MVSIEETARLKELGKLGKARTAVEQTEFEGLRTKAKDAKEKEKTSKPPTPSNPPGQDDTKGGAPETPGESKKTVSFDTAGATHVVTMRNSKAVKVWFKDGKEIGVEDAG